MKDGESMKTKFGNANINSEGYYVITSTKEGNHGKKLHRLIFEDFYQSSLPENIVIHHEDENKLNNNIWNLVCMTKEEHTILHSTGRKHSEASKLKMSKTRKAKGMSEAQKRQLEELHKLPNPMLGRHHSKETKQKISKTQRKYDFCGQNTYFKKGMSSADSPRRCFEIRYNKRTIPIGYFNEWISCDIINELIEEAIDCH